MDFLRRFALKLRAPEPEDLAQDVLCRAIEQAHLYQPETSIKAWLGTLMVHLHRNQMRDRARIKRGAPTVPLIEAMELAAPARQLSHVRLAEAAAAFDDLSPHYQVIIKLCAIDGLTYADAAARLGVPIGTVMSRLARARERLARLR